MDGSILFSDKEYQRMTLEAASHLDEFFEQDITDMHNAMHELAINAALLENWRRGMLSIAWNIQDQEIQWAVTEKGNRTVEAMGR